MDGRANRPSQPWNPVTSNESVSQPRYVENVTSNDSIAQPRYVDNVTSNESVPQPRYADNVTSNESIAQPRYVDNVTSNESIAQPRYVDNVTSNESIAQPRYVDNVTSNESIAQPRYVDNVTSNESIAQPRYVDNVTSNESIAQPRYVDNVTSNESIAQPRYVDNVTSNEAVTQPRYADNVSSNESVVQPRYVDNVTSNESVAQPRYADSNESVAQPRYADNEPSSSVNPVSFAQSMYRAGTSLFPSNVSQMQAAFADSFGISRSVAEASVLYQPAESSYQVVQERHGEYPVHQLVVDADRVLSGNRAVAQAVVDSTVSGSGLGASGLGGSGIRRAHTQESNEAVNVPHSSSLLHSVSLHSSSSLSSFSQSEVTTTGGTMALVGPGTSASDEMEAAVSSMNEANLQPEPSSSSKKHKKKHRRDLDEPDTTQDDDEDYQPSPTERDYMSDDSDGLDGNVVREEPVEIPSSMHVDPVPRQAPPSLFPAPRPSTNVSLRSVKITAAPASGLISPDLIGSQLGQSTDHAAASARSSCAFQDSVPASGHMIQPHQLPPHLQMPPPSGSGAHLVAPSPLLPAATHTSSTGPSVQFMVDPTMFGPTSTVDDRLNDMQNYMSSQQQPGGSGSGEERGDAASTSSSSAAASQPDTNTAETTIITSRLDAKDLLPRRKSNRIKILENELHMYRKPKYHDKPYNSDYLWCEECYDSFEVECPVHKLTAIPDKVVFSRAWASLPLALQIYRLGEKEEEEDASEVELGVFAKRTIQKNTQFGPFVAELVDNKAKLSQTKFILTVERPDGEIIHYETSDENKCNWMMFVRPARTFAKQNLVAYQHGQDIYFTCTRTIDVKAELKVWYASHYAERWGFPRLEITEADLNTLEEQLSKFQCYECPKRFKTASALHKHLQVHDEPKPGTSGGMEGGGGETAGSTEGEDKRKRLLQSSSLAKKKMAAKKIKDMSNGDSETTWEENGSSNPAYHWKKRSTNIYLNKTLKKYQLRHDAETLRRSVQSMYRKDEDTGNEWVCNSCDLTFDNANLLNLHTLTHAAEDVALDEVKKYTYQLDTPILPVGGDMANGLDLANIVSLGQSFLPCPVCHAQFDNKKDLIEHAAEHGRSKSSRLPNYNRPYKCELCWKSFTTLERLQKHQLCHGDEDSKPMQCAVCYKRFMNNSALSCHMKTHSTGKYYECPICHEGFDQTGALREHSVIHASSDGMFNCPHCDKRFSEFLVLKKHVRGNHTNRFYPCPDCEKIFPRQDKLRLHMLRHQTSRDFMCENCGRQFKRKDKLKEHMKRMHSDERKERDRLKALRPSLKKFVPKVLPTEYHRFIYKCHLCMLGFKRRGMLVNHIAKRHPDVKPGSIPELNLPILKTQRDYYCQYCDKVYKSSSKRKSHIIKNHPGAELPMSSRKRSGIEEIPGIPNPTYSQTVGSVTTMPQQCEFCFKQYASKAKLLQHQRKKHPDIVPPLPDRPKRGPELMAQIQAEVAHQGTSGGGEPGTIQVIEAGDQPAGTDSVQAADLLTQAMSELTQSLKEYQQQTGTVASVADAAFLSARLASTPTMVAIQTTGANQATSTIELSTLNQALQHFAPAGTTLPIQVQVSGASSPIQIPLLTTTQAGGEGVSQTAMVTVEPSSSSSPPTSSAPGEGGPGGGEGGAEIGATSTTQAITFPINIVQAGGYVPKSWTNYTYKQE